MTNEKAVEALKQVRTYATAKDLEAVDYAIEVLEKLIEKNPSSPSPEDSTLKK